MLNDLIKSTRHLGTIYSGRVKSFDDLDVIISRLKLISPSNEYVVFANDVTKEDIRSLLDTVQVSAKGLFSKKFTRSATEFFVDFAFMRKGKTFYIACSTDVDATLIMPSEYVKPTNCLIIEDKD